MYISAVAVAAAGSLYGCTHIRTCICKPLSLRRGVSDVDDSSSSSGLLLSSVALQKGQRVSVYSTTRCGLRC